MSFLQTPSGAPPTGLRIAFGVLSLVLGIVALVWPDATLVIVGVLFGLQLLAAGIVRIIAAVSMPISPGWRRVLVGVLGVLTALVGIFCFFRPGASLAILLWLIAFGWLLEGIAELIWAFTGSHEGGTRIGLVLYAIVSILAAIVILVFPGESLIVLALTGGVILIILGIVILVGAWTGRRATATAS